VDNIEEPWAGYAPDILHLLELKMRSGATAAKGEKEIHFKDIKDIAFYMRLLKDLHGRN
jgi:hypothetical protein